MNTGASDAGHARGPGWLLTAMAVFVPCALALSHLPLGSEHPWPTVTFAGLWLAVAVITMIATRCCSATYGTIFVVIIAAIWIATGRIGNWHQASTEVTALIGAGALWLTGHALGRRGSLLGITWRALCWSLLVFCLFALLIHVSRYTGDPLAVSRIDTLRLRASFDSPNVAATLFAVALIIGAGQAIYTLFHPGPGVSTRQGVIDHFFRKGMSSIALIVVAGGCLTLTASRAGFVIGIAMLALLLAAEYGVYRKRHGQSRSPVRWMQLVIAAGGLLILFVAVSGEIMGLRAGKLSGDAMNRLHLFEIYWQAWREAPIWGHGLGSFNAVNDRIATLETAHMTVLLTEAHNVVLQWLIQQGIAGTAIIVLVWISIHVPLVRALSSGGARSRTFIRTALCVSGVVIFHGMVDYALEIPSVMWTYSLVLGLAHGRAFVLCRAPVMNRNELAEEAGRDANGTVGDRSGGMPEPA